MKSASAIYKMLRAAGNYPYETRVVKGNSIYTNDTLKSVSVYLQLTQDNGVSIGGAQAAECKLLLMEQSANWERMARFSVEFRINSGSKQSEWLTAGVFYTDERSEDKHGNLSIVAYDGMLRMEQTWTDKVPSEYLPSSYPITARAWATMIQNAQLATFYDLTQLDDTVALIGLNTATTIRDVLKTIASSHAGNWTMTTDERLKLVQFSNVFDNGTATQNNSATLGMSLDKLETSPSLSPVTGVHLETEEGTFVEAGTDNGYRVKAICAYSDTTGVAELCLGKINQYVYKPFQANGAYLDPRAEIGDCVSINNIGYQIMALDWTYGGMPKANVSAPYDLEVDHEYTILSQDAKNYRKTMSSLDGKLGDYVAKSEFRTEIIQNSQEITLIAESTCVPQSVYDEQIREIQSQLDGSIQTWSGNAVPTLNNSPAVDWNTTALKAEHVGDTYFVNSDAGIPEAGSYYRFENNNGVYSWQLLTDSALTEALAQAAAAQAAAESAQNTAEASMTEAQAKGRIFVVQPTTPYDVGDLWFNDAQSVIKVCMNARASGNFVSSDWVKRDKYIDDVALEAYLAESNTITAIKDQIDQKAETYYQAEDPSSGWGVKPVGRVVAGVDVVGIPSSVGSIHEGDLWYRTTDGTTWYYDGGKWVLQDIPEEVFDKIDGKAQIFITSPYPPYASGDLWFDGTQGKSDIKTCIHDRAVGESFNSSDWVKYNKYTDDKKANEVGEQLTDFQETFSRFDVMPDQIRAQVDERVVIDKRETKNQFGWYLDSTSHTWYSNGNTVMTVTESGLTLTGTITATAGYIGSATQRFIIGEKSIYNGKQARDDANAGIYLGTDGISLGANSVFKVETNGKITASSGTIGGFTLSTSSMYSGGMSTRDDTTHDGVFVGTTGIALGRGNFKVTSGGALTAKSGTVGGFTLSATSLKNTNTSSTAYTAGLNAPTSPTSTTVAIWAGAASATTSSPFYVDYSGRLKASNATIDGKITTNDLTATGGTIGGLSIESSKLYKTKSSMTSTSSGVYIGTDGIALGAYNSTNGNSAFQVTSAGALTARSGTVGGFTLGESSIYKTKNSMTSTASGVYVGTNGIALGAYDSTNKNSAFQVTSAGVLTARSGTVGGFTLNASSLYNGKGSVGADTTAGVFIGTSGIALGDGTANHTFKVTSAGAMTVKYGMTSLGDTTNNGVYIGTDGIAFGKGYFKVTSGGAVTAKNLEITGGSIKLGGTTNNPVFSVSTTGAVTASNLALTGGSISIKDSSNKVVFSANSSGVTVNGNGTFSGTVYAGNIVSSATTTGAGYMNGNGISAGTISAGLQGNTATGQLSVAACNSLGYADLFNSATQSSSTLDYFKAKQIVASTSFYSPKFIVADTSGGTNEYNLNGHYHSFTEQNGKIIIGPPNNATSTDQRSFNIADTKTFKDAVKAINVTSLSYSAWNFVSGDKTVTFTNNYTDYTNGSLRGRAIITLDNGNTCYGRISMSGTKAYNAGVESVDALAASNYIGYEEDDHGDTDYKHIWIKLENSKVIGNIALPSGGGSSVSRIRLGDYGSSATVFPYYRQTSTTGTIKAVAVDSSGTELRSDDLNITELIEYVYEDGGGGGGGTPPNSVTLTCSQITHGSNQYYDYRFVASLVGSTQFTQGRSYTFYYY